MRPTPRAALVLAFTALAMATPLQAQETPSMSKHHQAAGPFDVKVTPEPLSSAGERAGMSRMSLDKRYHGDLQAQSQGEMLAYGNPGQGNAGYVAIEKVTGELQGRRGSFALQHSSALENGVPRQAISVVPGSGTGELQGLAGTLAIDIAADGSHRYRFDYTLP